MTNRQVSALFAALLFGTLSGCAPTVERSSENSIRLAGVTDVDLPTAAAMAEQHCAQYGKTAEQAFDRIPDGRVLFKCVK